MSAVYPVPGQGGGSGGGGGGGEFTPPAGIQDGETIKWDNSTTSFVRGTLLTSAAVNATVSNALSAAKLNSFAAPDGSVDFAEKPAINVGYMQIVSPSEELTIPLTLKGTMSSGLLSTLTDEYNVGDIIANLDDSSINICVNDDPVEWSSLVAGVTSITFPDESTETGEVEITATKIGAIADGATINTLKFADQESDPDIPAAGFILYAKDESAYVGVKVGGNDIRMAVAPGVGGQKIINTFVGGVYTLTTEDACTTLMFDSTTNVQCKIPDAATVEFDDGTWFEIVTINTGEVTITKDAAVTLPNPATTDGRYSRFLVRMLGTNSFFVQDKEFTIAPGVAAPTPVGPDTANPWAHGSGGANGNTNFRLYNWPMSTQLDDLCLSFGVNIDGTTPGMPCTYPSVFASVTAKPAANQLTLSSVAQIPLNSYIHIIDNQAANGDAASVVLATMRQVTAISGTTITYAGANVNGSITTGTGTGADYVVPVYTNLTDSDNGTVFIKSAYRWMTTTDDSVSAVVGRLVEIVLRGVEKTAGPFRGATKTHTWTSANNSGLIEHLTNAEDGDIAVLFHACNTVLTSDTSFSYTDTFQTPIARYGVYAGGNSIGAILVASTSAGVKPKTTVSFGTGNNRPGAAQMILVKGKPV